MRVRKFLIRVFFVLTGAILVTGGLPGGKAFSQPFGKADDIAFAKLIWEALEKQKLAGPGAVNAVPYPATPPHGKILETFFSTATLGGHTGELIVKRNYGGPDITRTKVANNRAKYIKAVTVMFKKGKGFDAKNKDWFWAKFKPNGSLAKAPDGSTSMAGRVTGCAQCHSLAVGGGMVYTRTAEYFDRK